MPLYFSLVEFVPESNVTTVGVGFYFGLLISLTLVGQIGVNRIVSEESADVGEPLVKKALRRIRGDRLTLIALFVMIAILLISLHTAFITERLIGVTYFTSDPQRTFQPIPLFLWHRSHL